MHWTAPPEKDTATVTLEKNLWDAADQSRANSGLKPQVLRPHPRPDLPSLRLPAHEPGGGRVYEPAAYHAEGILYLAPEARFDYLQTLPEGEDIGAKVNRAMRGNEMDSDWICPRT